MDTTKELPTVISFCSGYGGIERGLDLAGFKHRVVAYVEIEAYAIANLLSKMEQGRLEPAPIYSNLTSFPAHLFRDKISLITGGYPCQPFSSAGKRLGADDPRHLWPHIRRHIESIRPISCFFENVEGHISLGLREVISELESDGYRSTWGIFSAREVGAPHQRKRVYILGNTKHNGPSATTIRRSVNSSSNDNAQREDGSCKLEGASKPQGGGDIQKNKLGDTKSSGCSRRPQDIEREGSENISQRPDQNLWRESERSGAVLADSISEGLQGCERIPGDTRQDRERRESADGSATERGNGCEQSIREAEPRLGGGFDGASSWMDGSWELGIDRVISECPDRVDRVRQLGNGVVPQTAAKAWITLNDRFCI